MARENVTPIAEEIIIEQQTVEELREQITNLKNELAEQKKRADKMGDLAWENLKNKEKLEKELEEEKERVQKELEAKNRIIDDLQQELAKEKGWWDKWMNGSKKLKEIFLTKYLNENFNEDRINKICQKVEKYGSVTKYLSYEAMAFRDNFPDYYMVTLLLEENLLPEK